jgi:hypothetical protein
MSFLRSAARHKPHSLALPFGAPYAIQIVRYSTNRSPRGSNQRKEEDNEETG